MKAEKYFLKSKTVIGVILSMLPTLLPVFGVSFSEQDGQFVTSSADAILQGIGAALAIYGRFVAEDKVKA